MIGLINVASNGTYALNNAPFENTLAYHVNYPIT